MHRPLTRALVCAAAGLLAGCGDEETTGPPVLQPGQVATVVGMPRFLAFNGDGHPAAETGLYYPIDLAFDLEGRLVVDDWNNIRIRRVEHDGTVSTIVGTGVEPLEATGDGVPALGFPLHHHYSMDYDAEGTLYLAGFHAPQVIRVREGLVHIIAGTDDFGYAGDGGPGREARLDSPCGVAVAPGGAPVYIADTFNHAIRMLAADGTISTLAGTGERGYAGDGGPAAAAVFNEPYRIRYHATTGDLYVSDTYNHAVRRIAADGTVTTVAGTGDEGFSGDGGPANQARLAYPYDARVGPDGALYIADSANHRIRRVAPDGTITTVAGTGERGATGDYGPARSAAFNNPSAVAFDGEGNLWIADTYNSTVRMVLGFFDTP